MAMLQTIKLQESSISYLARLQNVIDFEPAFQRQGDIWTLPKKQLLIDSIINDYDVPKLYLHELASPKVRDDGQVFRYALIDGKQRLEAIFGYLDGDFGLSDDFEYFRDENLKLGELKFSDLRIAHPALAAKLLERQLDVVIVRTDDDDLVEDMFSRLNEAVPLNSAEKRNAWSGPAREAVKRLIDHDLFTKCLPFADKRFRHQDLATKFLSIEEQYTVDSRLIDTKRARLDSLFVRSKNGEASTGDIAVYERSVNQVLDLLSRSFSEKDKLLTSVGTVVVYYLLFRKRGRASRQPAEARDLSHFEIARRTTPVDEEAVDFEPGNLAFKEYNRLVQSTNDGKALVRRMVILETYINALESGQDPVSALAALNPAP